MKANTLLFNIRCNESFTIPVFLIPLTFRDEKVSIINVSLILIKTQVVLQHNISKDGA